MHPDWCQAVRCHADTIGEHRSEPVTVGAGSAGGIVATRVRTRAGRDRLELRVTAPLGSGTDDDQAAAARALLACLVDALNRAARLTAGAGKVGGPGGDAPPPRAWTGNPRKGPDHEPR
jgi:hypothetical protein